MKQRRGSAAIGHLGLLLAVAVFVAMMVQIVVNGVLRAFAESGVPHTLEIVQYWYMPTIALLGIVAAQTRSEHISTDLLFQFMPQRAKPVVLTVVLLLVAGVAALAAWFGLDEALHSFEIRKTAGGTSIPSWPPYFLIPMVFTVLALQFLVAAVRAFWSAFHKVEESIEQAHDEELTQEP